MINSIQKGKAGEREFAKWLRDNLGLNARRGVQYSGSPDSPDVVGWEGVHVEVKRTEKLSLHSALAQAKRDCGSNVPIVAHRRNRSEWIFILEAKDLIELCKLIPPTGI